MCPTCALSYAARVGFRSNDSDPRHAQGESARVRPLLRPAAPAEGRVLSSAHCPHCQTRRFSRGVILIGALSKVLRLPLLQESGRLRQKQDNGATTWILPLILDRSHPYAQMVQKSSGSKGPATGTNDRRASERPSAPTPDRHRQTERRQQGRARTRSLPRSLSHPSTHTRANSL